MPFTTVTTDRGDIVELRDSSGTPFAAYSYDAWGSPLSVTSTGTASVDATRAAAIAVQQPLRYAGYCWDEHSGCYYLSARTYEPATRQFLTKDPAKADGEESAYQYCGGDPVGKVDPSGEWGKLVHYTRTKEWLKYLVTPYWLAYVANGNIDMDYHPLNAPWPPTGWFYHFNSRATSTAVNKTMAFYGPGTPDSRIDFAEQCLSDAVVWWRNGYRETAARRLGMGMHAGQDTYAHGNLTPLAHRIYTNAIYVDETWYLPWRVHSTKIWTGDYVKRFLRGVFRSTIQARMIRGDHLVFRRRQVLHCR